MRRPSVEKTHRQTVASIATVYRPEPGCPGVLMSVQIWPACADDMFCGPSPGSGARLHDSFATSLGAGLKRSPFGGGGGGGGGGAALNGPDRFRTRTEVCRLANGIWPALPKADFDQLDQPLTMRWPQLRSRDTFFAKPSFQCAGAQTFTLFLPFPMAGHVLYDRLAKMKGARPFPT